MAHAGSWFGLPDFGITEKIGGVLGRPTTSQGGSNLIGGPQKQQASSPSQSATAYGPTNTGSVLGSQAPRNSGSYSAPQQSQPQQNQPQQNNEPAYDPYAQVRSEISGAWDSYLNSLNDTSGYLNEQQGAQEGIANSQFQQGQDVINSQKAASLKDIANTTRNAFQAGNNYLGSLGAGDSSGANQYSFAVNQQASKQTGDLNNFVNTQMAQLKSTHEQQIQSIASWFSQQQQALKQQMAQGGLQKGQDLANLSKGILDQAMQATNQIKANTQNQYNGLLSWAASNSQNLGQLQQNIAGIPQAMGQLQLGSQGVGATPTYGGGAVAQKTDIFGNPIV